MSNSRKETGGEKNRKEAADEKPLHESSPPVRYRPYRSYRGRMNRPDSTSFGPKSEHHPWARCPLDRRLDSLGVWADYPVLVTVVKSGLDPFAASLPGGAQSIGRRYRCAFRQPLAVASSSVQNQRSPAEEVITWRCSCRRLAQRSSTSLLLNRTQMASITMNLTTSAAKLSSLLEPPMKSTLCSESNLWLHFKPASPVFGTRIAEGIAVAVAVAGALVGVAVATCD